MACARRFNFGQKRWIAIGTVNAVGCFIMLGIAIMEKTRLTPFVRAMQCETPAPFAMRASQMIPQGAYIYLNMTSATKCKNPMPATITQKAAGSKIEMFLPNLTSFFAGGPGFPYTKVADGHLLEDAEFSSGGGSAEIKQITRMAMPLGEMAAMAATSAVQGYAPQFIKTTFTIESCFSLFGMPMCQEATQETWCGAFGGACLAQSLDSNNNPIIPTQWEPASCGMTKSICGKEADMKAALNFEALGGTVTGQIPCPPATLLPNTTMCNVVTAPGVHPVTFQAQVIDPPTVLTAQAQKEMDEAKEKAQFVIDMLLLPAIVFYAIGGVACIGFTCFCIRRYIQARKSGGTEGQAAANGPTILQTRNEQEKQMSV